MLDWLGCSLKKCPYNKERSDCDFCKFLIRKCCGNCKYHQYEEYDKGYVCVNDSSEHCTDWTENDDTCKYWEQE